MNRHEWARGMKQTQAPVAMILAYVAIAGTYARPKLCSISRCQGLDGPVPGKRSNREMFFHSILVHPKSEVVLLRGLTASQRFKSTNGTISSLSTNHDCVMSAGLPADNSILSCHDWLFPAEAIGSSLVPSASRSMSRHLDLSSR